MFKDTRAKLLARRLKSASDLENELALLATLPTEKQEIVFERLSVIDRYLAKPLPTLADADLAAAQMGVARRQLYRLMAKLGEVGPTRALSPGFRNVERSAPSKDGLAEPIEAVIKQALISEPDAKISDVSDLVRVECERLGELNYPGQTAIRRRVHALRRVGFVPPAKGGVGARLVIDQVCLNLTVYTTAGASLTIGTFIIDRDTRLILGVGLTASDGVGNGLLQAISDIRIRSLEFVFQVLSVAPRITDLMWIVPPGLEDFADIACLGSLPDSRQPEIEVIGAGPRRHGDAILRLLGDKIGPFVFRRLAELRERPPLADKPAIHIEDAQRVLRSTARQWNQRIISSIASVEPSSSERARRLRDLRQDLATIFFPLRQRLEAEASTIPTQAHHGD